MKKYPDSVNEPASERYQVAEKARIFQFVEMAKELSPAAIKKLADKLASLAKQNAKGSVSGLSSFLLKGPQMSDSQFEEFQKQRESLNQWRLK